MTKEEFDKLKVGDKIWVYGSESEQCCSLNDGKEALATITSLSEPTIFFTFDEKDISCSHNFGVIRDDGKPCFRPCFRPYSTSMKLNTMMKRVLDKDIRVLIKADIIDGNLEFTATGKEALYSILFEENKAELVKIAQQILKDKKEEKDCC